VGCRIDITATSVALPCSGSRGFSYAATAIRLAQLTIEEELKMSELQTTTADDGPFITDGDRREAEAYFLGAYTAAGANPKAIAKIKAALQNAEPDSQLARIAETVVRMGINTMVTEALEEERINDPVASARRRGMRVVAEGQTNG
jgi:hypothetical protein